MECSPDMVRLDGSNVIITGAARGIGRATAHAAVRFGARVAVVDKLGDELATTVTSLQGMGGEVVPHVGDVRTPEVLDDWFASIAAEMGSIDVVVNNAGGGFWAPFTEVSPKGEGALISENFTQVTGVIRRAVPLMADGGSIVNVTSIEAHRAGPGFAIYSAMKAALENLSKTLALELADRGIRVNTVAPDMIPTEGDAELGVDSAALSDDRYAPQPSYTDGTPDDVAAAIMFLAGPMSRFVTGTCVHVDGGTFAASGWRRRMADGGYAL